MSTSSLPVIDGSESAISKAGLTEMAVYETKDGPVKLMGLAGKPLVETSEWKLYAAQLPGGQLGLLMIAVDAGFNDVIDWQEYVLNIMQSQADDIDKKLGSAEFSPNYGAFFPKVFASIDADGRKALVLGYHPSIKTYRELRPLSTIPEDKRVDLKTVMWILGKSLKLATLFHDAGMTIGNVYSDNVFITMDNIEVHGVFYFDFTFAFECASESAMQAELANMASTAWFAAGGTKTTEPELDMDIMTVEQHAEFVGNLKRMMSGEVTNAQTEMDRLYEINDRIWPKIPIEGGPNSRGQELKRQWHVFQLRNR
jgi:hypothetical protein